MADQEELGAANMKALNKLHLGSMTDEEVCSFMRSHSMTTTEQDLVERLERSADQIIRLNGLISKSIDLIEDLQGFATKVTEELQEAE